MFDAILGGKLPRKHDGSEDVLTSVVFGALELLPLEHGLLRVLATAEPPVPAPVLTATEATFEFWPWWHAEDEPQGAEPDVVLELAGPAGQRWLIVVECKRASGKSGLDGDQLAREVMNGLVVAKSRKAEFAGLLYVTKHLTVPMGELADSAAELVSRGVSANLWWASWRDMAPILMEARSRVGGPAGVVSVKAARCLERWALVRFCGVAIPEVVPTYTFEPRRVAGG